MKIVLNLILIIGIFYIQTSCAMSVAPLASATIDDMDNLNWLEFCDSYVTTDKCRDRQLKELFSFRWKEVKDFYFKFKKAVADNNKKVISKMVHFPFIVHATGFDIRNEKDFLKKYDLIFDEDTREMVAESEYKDLYIFGTGIIIACKFADPLMDSSVSFSLFCAKDLLDQRICQPYKIGIDFIKQ